MIVWDLSMILAHIPEDNRAEVEASIKRMIAFGEHEEREACAKIAQAYRPRPNDYGAAYVSVANRHLTRRLPTLPKNIREHIPHELRR